MLAFTGRAYASTPSKAMQALLDAYPDFITEIADNRVIFADGTELPWDDGLQKTHRQLLDGADIEDMFTTRYDDKALPPPYLSDPGRSRCDLLFKKMYGATAAAVQRNLVSVNWLGRTIKFTKVNGAADSLQKVAFELAARPHLRKYLACSGTFNWRRVRSANRMSAHAYGIAIDIAVSHSDFWQWRNPRATEEDHIDYRNQIPAEIVDIFRRHGFIWGGAWYHFDTMHFEFRPEIINYTYQ